MLRGSFVICAVLLLTMACSGSRECWGDCSLEGEAIMVARNDDGTFVEIKDGDPVALTLPVQGGRVLFVSALLKNFEKYGIGVLGEVRNPDTGVVVARDLRRVDYPQAADNGFGQPDLSGTSDMPNIAVCPNYLSRDMLDQEWLLDVTVTDSRRNPVKVTRRVVPQCRHSDPTIRAGCECECLGCFALGKCAQGTPPTGCDGGR